MYALKIFDTRYSKITFLCKEPDDENSRYAILRAFRVLGLKARIHFMELASQRRIFKDSFEYLGKMSDYV